MKALRVVVLSLFALLLFTAQAGFAEEVLAPLAQIEPLAAPAGVLFAESGGCEVGAAEPSFLDFESPTPRANFCTKEVCSVNRQDCQAACLPCGFSFRCNFPGCYSCQCFC